MSQAADSILLLDSNAPWVRSLFSPIAKQRQVHALAVKSGLRPPKRAAWEHKPDGLWDKPAQVPGWTRLPSLSTFLIARAARKAIRQFNVKLIVHTLPFYAGVAEQFAGKIPQAYYAHDPFRFYDWDVPTTLALEKRMLTACEMTFAISRALAADLQARTARPVVYSPNAVSSDFLEKLSRPGASAAELSALPRPIIGCIGQINKSYDWNLIAALARGLPDATFVFVGPIFNESPDVQRPMRQAMELPNIKWLGPMPHARLPEFLRGFDICLNALAINDHNHRRSPLRFYDYLATDKPIVSTAVGEAAAHAGLIATFDSPAGGIDLIRRILAPSALVDLAARARYIRANTWETRAVQVMEHLDSLKPARSAAG